MRRSTRIVVAACAMAACGAFAGKWYQDTDKDYVDYRLYKLFDFPSDKWNWFRGPRVEGKRYIACVGAAQTFGRFAKRPYPMLLGERLAVETLNLGLGGVGPTFFSREKPVLDAINRSSLAIVQVFSARTGSSSFFKTINHDRWGHRASDDRLMTAQEFFDDLARTHPDKLRQHVEETRADYVRNMIELLDAIKVPKVLLWYSVRKPDYEDDYGRPSRLFGDFPHLVNREMIDEIRKHADAYVECVSSRGLPQEFRDEQGKLVPIKVNSEGTSSTTANTYYPSPEMHVDASNLLEPVVRKLLARGDSK